MDNRARAVIGAGIILAGAGAGCKWNGSTTLPALLYYSLSQCCQILLTCLGVCGELPMWGYIWRVM